MDSNFIAPFLCTYMDAIGQIFLFYTVLHCLVESRMKEYSGSDLTGAVTRRAARVWVSRRQLDTILSLWGGGVEMH